MVLDLKELEKIETAEAVALSINPATGRIAAQGSESAVDRVIARIAEHRDEVAALLRHRQGLPDEKVVTREIAVAVPSLATQRERYIAWMAARPAYYQHDESTVDLMWSQLREGDLVHPDYAKSVTIERDGKFFAVDCRGRITEPSKYAPALQARRREGQSDG